MNKELAKTLTTAIVQFIDKERPEGTMCCSDTECAGIEKMFEGDKFDIIEAFIQKKLSRLTEWEKEVRHFSDACARRPNYIPSDGDIRNWAAELLALAREQFIKDGYIIEKKAFHDAVEKVDPEVMKEVSENVDKANEEELTEFEQEVSDMVEYCKEHGEHVALDYAKRHARTLLALAKKELLSHADESNPKIKIMTNLKRTYFSNPDKLPKWLKDDIAIKELNAHTKGYTKGYKNAEKFYNDFVAYRNPTMPTTGFGCDGIRCTNPHMDCINCPRRATVGFNTTCDTSTEALHGNTSATDGKEHNPSFTD